MPLFYPFSQTNTFSINSKETISDAAASGAILCEWCYFRERERERGEGKNGEREREREKEWREREKEREREREEMEREIHRKLKNGRDNGKVCVQKVNECWLVLKWDESEGDNEWQL